jgi:hypothetical protein
MRLVFPKLFYEQQKAYQSNKEQRRTKMSILPEFSPFSPALTVFNQRLFVAWTGTDDATLS